MKYLVFLLSAIALSGCGSGAPQGETNVYVYGDNITTGSATNNVSYASLGIQKLNMIEVDNAVAGSTLFSANQYNQMLSDVWAAGSIVVLMTGNNDAIAGTNVAQYSQGLANIMAKIHGSAVQRAYIMTPLQVLTNGSVTNSTIAQYAAANKQAVSAINDSRIKVIDFNSYYQPSSQLDIDWMIPNVSGQQQLATYWLSNF